MLSIKRPEGEEPEDSVSTAGILFIPGEYSMCHGMGDPRGVDELVAEILQYMSQEVEDDGPGNSTV